MIQRRTIILFLLFLVFLVGTIYVNQDSNLQVSLGLLTTTPTNLPELSSGFSFTGINQVEFTSTEKDGPNFLIKENSKGDWYTEDNQAVNLSAVFSIVQYFSSIKLEGTVENNVSLDSVGLSSPSYQIIFIDKENKKNTLLVGNKTVNQSGYYVKWNNGPVSIVSGNEIDLLVGVFSNDALLVETPTPLPSTPTALNGSSTSTPTK